MDLKDFKIDLPKNWKEISRSGGENQVIIRLCHIDPLTKVDPKIFKSQTIPSPGLEFGIFRAPVPIPTDQETLKDSHEGMISIARYPTEEIARQTFKNMALTPTQGLNVPVPGGVQIPGMPQNITITELLKSDIFKKYLPKEQLEQLEKAMPKLKEFQKKIQEQAKPDLEKLGAKFKEGKYLGHEAIYIEGKNPLLRPQTEQIPISAGGGYIHLDPLPKISQPYSEKFNMYQAILVKNFIITEIFYIGLIFCHQVILLVIH